MPPVRVLLFASAREAVGRGSLRCSVPEGGKPLAVFLDELVAAHPRLGPVLRISRVARNGELLANVAGRVRSGDEIAIHPPYSGG